MVFISVGVFNFLVHFSFQKTIEVEMAWLLNLALLCASSTYAFPAHSTRSSSPTVTVKNGTIAGLHSSTYNQDMFLGVPFAQPPVGELRFRNPQSIKNKFGSTVQATEYAPECVGYGVRLLSVW